MLVGMRPYMSEVNMDGFLIQTCLEWTKSNKPIFRDSRIEYLGIAGIVGLNNPPFSHS